MVTPPSDHLSLGWRRQLWTDARRNTEQQEFLMAKVVMAGCHSAPGLHWSCVISRAKVATVAAQGERRWRMVGSVSNVN
jgi:hypothetical protein